MDLRKEFEKETGNKPSYQPYMGRGGETFTSDYVKWLEAKDGQHETIIMWRTEKGEERLYIAGKNIASVYPMAEGGYGWHLWDADGVGGQNAVEDTLYEAKVQAGGRAILDFAELIATTIY